MAAQDAATKWVASLDRDRIKETWTTSSSFLQNKVSADAWTASMGKIRETKGRVKERRLVSVFERHDVPGAPSRFVIAFDWYSTTDKAGEAVERISMMLCEDGQWRVMGYSLY
jgi:hypothetical protein